MIAPSPRGLVAASTPYPSPADSLDSARRSALDALRQGDIGEDELSQATEYVSNVERWATDVGRGNPAVESEVAQASWFRAGVREAYGRIQVSRAITENRPELVSNYLSRGFEDLAVASALNWGGPGLNRVVQGLDEPGRASMALVLSRSERITYLNPMSVSQLRSALPSVGDQRAFNQRYPLTNDMMFSTLV